MKEQLIEAKKKASENKANRSKKRQAADGENNENVTAQEVVQRARAGLSPLGNGAPTHALETSVVVQQQEVPTHQDAGQFDWNSGGRVDDELRGHYRK